MAELNGGQITARQLQAAGIDTIFGVVGGPMIEIFAGAAELGMKVVNCRHEESAAFMASAWGYIHRKPGVMVAASGPGMTNAVTPLYVATESAMPLVVLGGSTFGPSRGLGGFQGWNFQDVIDPIGEQDDDFALGLGIAQPIHCGANRLTDGRAVLDDADPDAVEVFLEPVLVQG